MTSSIGLSLIQFRLTIMDSTSSSSLNEFCYLQNGGGLEVALMENAASFLAPLASNKTFVSAIFALFVTQSTKVFFHYFEERRWNFRLMFSPQGIPSSRSAMCSALTTSVALSHGVAYPLFPISLGFSLIVMSDSVSVTRQVGYQALVLNKLLLEVSGGVPILDEDLEEDVGHTVPQVLTSALLGSTVAILCSLTFVFLRR
ncbi:uncharacterized protein LOC131612927 [Vicia villosa]|uniref:uncharacterized protein LOC131612927 n=1 Tax=Vicia villosa TaxID=3911 RepID=UPI00273C4570|nr:uncharacterized protein LOC131612927 [Vicia villosa]